MHASAFRTRNTGGGARQKCNRGRCAIATGTRIRAVWGLLCVCGRFFITPETTTNHGGFNLKSLLAKEKEKEIAFVRSFLFCRRMWGHPLNLPDLTPTGMSLVFLVTGSGSKTSQLASSRYR